LFLPFSSSLKMICVCYFFKQLRIWVSHLFLMCWTNFAQIKHKC
jgi:hypothetical protein